MKYPFIVLVLLYQALFPRKFRGKCLFKESCSNFVMRVTREKGFMRSVKALWHRIKNCRPGYHLIELNGIVYLITKESLMVEEKDIDERLIVSSKS